MHVAEVLSFWLQPDANVNRPSVSERSARLSAQVTLEWRRRSWTRGPSVRS